MKTDENITGVKQFKKAMREFHSMNAMTVFIRVLKEEYPDSWRRVAEEDTLEKKCECGATATYICDCGELLCGDDPCNKCSNGSVRPLEESK